MNTKTGQSDYRRLKVTIVLEIVPGATDEDLMDSLASEAEKLPGVLAAWTVSR
jgi:hypothetical protein